MKATHRINGTNELVTYLTVKFEITSYQIAFAIAYMMSVGEDKITKSTVKSTIYFLLHRWGADGQQGLLSSGEINSGGDAIPEEAYQLAKKLFPSFY